MKQRCPICKRYIKSLNRYPNYLCNRCVLLVTDKDGVNVEFCNTDFSGHGCVGRYRKGKKKYPLDICYIRNKVCKAEGAYFGGIIIISV